MQEEAGGVARAVQQGECLDAIEEAQVCHTGVGLGVGVGVRG